MKTLNIRLLFIFISLFILSFAYGQATSPKKLKAVLVLGHLEDETAEAITTMNTIANVLIENGVDVQKFYDAKAEWSSITAASKGAHFFIYKGHGSQMNENGVYGGLCINPFVSNKQIAEELHLSPNALVLLQSVCGGAGSSASDGGEIELTEAFKRVSDYSLPFFKAGAAAYFAVNSYDGVADCLKLFFEGNSIGECFNKAAAHFYKVEPPKNYPYNNTKKIVVASSDWGGAITLITYENGIKIEKTVPSYKIYNIAFVADPLYNIKDLKKN